MSETVKIVVELSKGQYEHLKDTQYGGIGARMIFNKVVNGKPLSRLIPRIKAEINQLPLVLLAGNHHIDKDSVMQILDNVGKGDKE